MTPFRQALEDYLVLSKASSPNILEGKALLQLVQSLSSKQAGIEAPRLELQRKLEHFLASMIPSVETQSTEMSMSPAVAASPVDEEYFLDQISHQLRQLCLDIAHQATSPYYKSPPQPHHFPLASGGVLNYSYERQMTPTDLDERLEQQETLNPSWQGKHLLFCSGMTSLMMAVQSCLHFLKPQGGTPLQLGLWGGYFETQHLLNIFDDSSLIWTQCQGQIDLWKALEQGHFDVLLLESVCYNWQMDVLDLDALGALWCSNLVRRPRAVIIDTTLVNQIIPINQILEQFGAFPPQMLILCRSGNKLDQQGLDLTNVGVLSVYTPLQTACQTSTDSAPNLDPLESGSPSRANLSVVAAQVRDFLIHARKVMGLGLSLSEVVCLDLPFCLNQTYSVPHAQAVFAGNADLALAIQQTLHNTPHSIFKQVVHPVLTVQHPHPWVCAPFVILHLADDSIAIRLLLLTIIDTERRRRRFFLIPGASFGFRHHRFEVLWFKSSSHEGLLKIAMGSRSGYSRHETIDLLTHLASFTSYQALAEAYPDAAELAQNLLANFAALSTLN